MSKLLEWAEDFQKKSGTSAEAITNPTMIKLWLQELATAIIEDSKTTQPDNKRGEA